MVVKQGDLRSNLKKYFDIVVDVEPVVVPRKDNRNVVIVSEEQYRAMMQNDRMQIYSTLMTKAPSDIHPIRSYTETTDISSIMDINDVDTLSANFMRTLVNAPVPIAVTWKVRPS